jgi:hypothetical protein
MSEAFPRHGKYACYVFLLRFLRSAPAKTAEAAKGKIIQTANSGIEGEGVGDGVTAEVETGDGEGAGGDEVGVIEGADEGTELFEIMAGLTRG